MDKLDLKPLQTCGSIVLRPFSVNFSLITKMSSVDQKKKKSWQRGLPIGRFCVCLIRQETEAVFIKVNTKIPYQARHPNHDKLHLDGDKWCKKNS